MVKFPNQLKVKLFADGADLAGIKAMYANPSFRTFLTAVFLTFLPTPKC